MLHTEAPAIQHAEILNHGANVAHLLSQINFLHGEVDRLEEQLNTVRVRAFKEAKDTAKQYEHAIEQKNAELQEWRGKTRITRGDADLPKRCAALEKQLALVHSENSVLSMEKNDLHAKLRKAESRFKSRISELNESVKSSSEETATSKEHLMKLSAALRALSDENTTLKRRLQDAKYKVDDRPPMREASAETSPTTSAKFTQTDTAVSQRRDAACQVASPLHFAESQDQSVHALSSALEQRVQECDGYRSRLEDLESVYADAQRLLSTAKARLTEESERRRLVSDDAEKMSIQVKSLQQKSSTQAAVERDLVERVRGLEEQRQQFRAKVMHMEREHGEVVAQLRQYEKDMQHLSSNKNYSNQQMSVFAGENENLRAEVQKLMVRESQLAFSLKAKDGEMHEILEAYRNAAKEMENMVENQRFLERELENVRAVLASKEDGINFLQEQLNGLHQREQQLILDVQTFEYENEQLHRKILHSDGGVGHLESRCQELQHLLLGRDQNIEKMHQSLAELSKQIVISENESMLLRRRCDSLEHDVGRLQAIVSSESERNRDLEEANARLVTRDVLSSFNSCESLSQELESVSAQLAIFKSNVDVLTQKLRNEEELRNGLQADFERTKNKLVAANESKERLEKIVLDQTRTLSKLSQ